MLLKENVSRRYKKKINKEHAISIKSKRFLVINISQNTHILAKMYQNHSIDPDLFFFFLIDTNTTACKNDFKKLPYCHSHLETIFNYFKQ